MVTQNETSPCTTAFITLPGLVWAEMPGFRKWQQSIVSAACSITHFSCQTIVLNSKKLSFQRYLNDIRANNCMLSLPYVTITLNRTKYLTFCYPTFEGRHIALLLPRLRPHFVFHIWNPLSPAMWLVYITQTGILCVTVQWIKSQGIGTVAMCNAFLNTIRVFTKQSVPVSNNIGFAGKQTLALALIVSLTFTMFYCMFFTAEISKKVEPALLSGIGELEHAVKHEKVMLVSATPFCYAPSYLAMLSKGNIKKNEREFQRDAVCTNDLREIYRLLTQQDIRYVTLGSDDYISYLMTGFRHSPKLKMIVETSEQAWTSIATSRKSPLAKPIYNAMMLLQEHGYSNYIHRRFTSDKPIYTAAAPASILVSQLKFVFKAWQFGVSVSAFTILAEAVTHRMTWNPNESISHCWFAGRLFRNIFYRISRQFVKAHSHQIDIGNQVVTLATNWQPEEN